MAAVAVVEVERDIAVDVSGKQVARRFHVEAHGVAGSLTIQPRPSLPGATGIR